MLVEKPPFSYAIFLSFVVLWCLTETSGRYWYKKWKNRRYAKLHMILCLCRISFYNKETSDKEVPFNNSTPIPAYCCLRLSGKSLSKCREHFFHKIGEHYQFIIDCLLVIDDGTFQNYLEYSCIVQFLRKNK